MVDKEKAKSVAAQEVNKRIVTREDAKKDFKKWIKEASLGGGFSKDVHEFWDEVSKQVDEL